MCASDSSYGTCSAMVACSFTEGQAELCHKLRSASLMMNSNVGGNDSEAKCNPRGVASAIRGSKETPTTTTTTTEWLSPYISSVLGKSSIA